MYSMEQVVNLAKHRGFVFPGSEIYGGLANTWDYGTWNRIKNNVKKLGGKIHSRISTQRWFRRSYFNEP